MKKIRLLILSLFFLATILPGCHKPDGLRTQSTYTFTNRTGRQITFDVYGAEDDYYQQKARLYQYTIEPDASQPIVMDAASISWIDWYTADYDYNNWQSDRSSYNHSSPPPELNIAAEDQEFAITSAIPDTARSVLLNGGGLSSTWRCTITDNNLLNGTHEFIFKKDFTCAYTYTNTSGNSLKSNNEYMLSQISGSVGIPPGFILYVLDQNQSAIFRLTCNTGYLLSPHTGRDTMMINFQQANSSQDYPLVRQ